MICAKNTSILFSCKPTSDTQQLMEVAIRFVQADAAAADVAAANLFNVYLIFLLAIMDLLLIEIITNNIFG